MNLGEFLLFVPPLVVLVPLLVVPLVPHIRLEKSLRSLPHTVRSLLSRYRTLATHRFNIAYSVVHSAFAIRL
jgi:hypothetical protein